MDTPSDSIRQAADQIIATLKSLNNGHHPSEVLNLVSEAICLKCGGDGPQSRCYCDYDSVWEEF